MDRVCVGQSAQLYARINLAMDSSFQLWFLKLKCWLLYCKKSLECIMEMKECCMTPFERGSVSKKKIPLSRINPSLQDGHNCCNTTFRSWCIQERVEEQHFVKHAGCCSYLPPRWPVPESISFSGVPRSPILINGIHDNPASRKQFRCRGCFKPEEASVQEAFSG